MRGYMPAANPAGINRMVEHASRSVAPGIDLLAADERLRHLHRQQLLRRKGQRIAVQDDEVGELARLERAFLVLIPAQEGRVEGVHADRLLDRHALFRTKDALAGEALAGDRRIQPHARIYRQVVRAETHEYASPGRHGDRVVVLEVVSTQRLD